MTDRRTLALVVGTRPEAIKVAPVALAAAAEGRCRPVVVATGQHDDMVVRALADFGVGIDARISVDPDRGGSQAALLGTLLPALESVLDRVAPDAVLVQGDTASAVAGALTGAWRQVPVVHLEAGLRSFDRANPFPEEHYRCLIGSVADLHLTPTPWATRNLLAEGVADEAIVCTGNTVVDAALHARAAATVAPGSALAAVQAAGHRLVLATVHRRESWGAPLRSITTAIARIVAAVHDVEVVLPAHPNPLVREVVVGELGGLDRVHVVEPLGYHDFIAHLAAATLVLSDSGGVQEEAPTFGVPVLVLRGTTERPEAVHAGTAELVGTDADRITGRALRLLRDEPARQRMAALSNPFGDGTSARQAIAAIDDLLDRRAGRPRPATVVAGAASSALAG